MNILMLISMAIIPYLITIGSSFELNRINNLADLLSSNNSVIFALIIVIFYFIISIMGLKFNRILTIILFLIGITGPIIIYYIFSIHSKTDFINIFNDYMYNKNGAKDAYNLVINTAREQGMLLTEKTDIFESFKALPIGFLCFIGFTYSVYIGGEVENPEKSQIKGILAALLLGIIIFTFCMYKYVNVVGQEFNAALGNPAVIEKVGLPSNSMNFISSILVDNPALNIIMQTGILVWFLLVPYIMLQVCIRNIIAWTTDSLFPKKILKRTKRTNDPWVASIIFTLIGMLFILIIKYSGLSLVGAIALAAIAYLFAGLSAISLPKSNPTVFSKAPSLAKQKFLGIISSNFQVLGILCVLGFGWIIYASIRYPEISGGTPIRALLMVLSVYISGLVIYQWRTRKLKKKEIDANINLDKLFSEIPED